MYRIELTDEEHEALKCLLVEEALRQDANGNKGTFRRSPLKAVYEKVRNAKRSRFLTSHHSSWRDLAR